MNINITYETLFEILRQERQKEEIQQLDKHFFPNVEEYLLSKKKIIDAKGNEGLFGADERSKTLRQFEGIQKILNELYQKRERKMVNLALHKSRTGSGDIDTSKLLKEEIGLYKDLVNVLDKYRQDILKNLLEFKRVTVNMEDLPGRKNKLIKFKLDVPSFMGPNLENFGPFDQQDICNLPAEIAEVIVKKGRAVFINV